jgi:hypothetical protein
MRQLSAPAGRLADVLLNRLVPHLEGAAATCVNTATLPSCGQLMGQSCNNGVCRQCVCVNTYPPAACNGRRTKYGRTFHAPAGSSPSCSAWRRVGCC